MHRGLDIFATLQGVVQRAVDSVSEAGRGSLLLREGDRLFYRAAAGFDAIASERLQIPSDAGALAAAPPFGPAAAPQAAREICVVPAATWYRAHLPGGVHLDLVPPEAGVIVAPIYVDGHARGYLAVEQPSMAVPEGQQRALIELLAQNAGAALERRGLYDEKAETAQSLRLLEDVLNAVAMSVDLPALVETVGNGIKSVQLGPDWSGVDLIMSEGEGRGQGASHDAESGRKIRIIRAPRQAPTSYWINVREGALGAGRSLQAAVQYRSGTVAGERSQGALIDEAVRRGVNGIAVAPMDSKGLEPHIRRAIEAGIPVVTFDSPPIEGSGALVYIGTDNIAAGRLAGEMFTRLLPEGGAVAPQFASFTARNGLERVEGARAAVGPGITIEPPSESCFDPGLGVKRAIAELAANPGLRGAFGACGDNGPSFAVAAKLAGRAGDLKIVTFDLATATIGMLREGLIHAAVLQREYDMGYLSVQVLYQMATRGIDATLAQLPASRFIDTGVDVVTLERTAWSSALADYLAQDTARRVANRRQGTGDAPDSPMEFAVIGMELQGETVSEESAPYRADSLVGRVMTSGRILIVDTASAEHDRLHDVVAARRNGQRTLAAVPLLARDAVLGVLMLSSERPNACSSSEDIAFLERIAGTAGVAIENARLLARISDRTRELTRANQHQESLLRRINELSSPVVPIARDILVMPLVGAMDAQRAGRFIEALLQEICDHQARVVLVDVTGMALVDATAVDHLGRAARAAHLLGAEMILVGLSPDAARLMTEEGLDLGAIATRSNLELGFVHALSKTGGRIVYSRAAAAAALRRA